MLSPMPLPRSLPLCLFALACLACGPKGKVEVPEGADKLWSEMDHGERMQHMGAVVMPRVRPVFQAHDAERFADFSCATCHGSGADRGDFAMPNPDLPKLYTANFYKKHRKEHPDIVKLMWQKVEPAVGEAIGVTYGLGGAQIECGSCHVEVGEEG